MLEHGFVKTPKAIVRVFGEEHPAGSFLGLLRYFKTDRGWVKPPVFAAETTSGPVLRKYGDLRTILVPKYGVRLGLVPERLAPTFEYVDPLLEASRLPTLVELSNRSGLVIGITGSRLAGLQVEGSDLDLVIYGRDSVAAARALKLSWPSLLPERMPPTTTLTKFVDRFRGTPDRIVERNLFKSVVLWGGSPTKLDIHYSPGGEASQDSFDPGVTIGRTSTQELRVVDDSRRAFFPGFLVCGTKHGQTFPLWIKDHSLAYALVGDLLVVRCERVVNRLGQQELVGVDLLGAERSG